jgi:hypothetical protein
VAVEDVLSNACVYVPDHHLFVSREPQPTTLARYRRQVASRQTILEQVRQQPDQTLPQALAWTHHDTQRAGPVMLSLACAHEKYVVEREGTVRFQTASAAGSDWFATAAEMRPQFGDGAAAPVARSLEGGWLPVPVISVEQGGLSYRQRSLVAPLAAPAEAPAAEPPASACVIDFEIHNRQPHPAPAALSLVFQRHGQTNPPFTLHASGSGPQLMIQDQVVGLVDTAGLNTLTSVVEGATLRLSGPLGPGATARCAVHLAPGREFQLHQLRQVGPASWRAAVQEYWQATLASATQIETPDPLLNHLIRSSQVRCLIAARHEAAGARVAPWIAAMSYGPLESEAHSVIRGMDFLGHAGFAQRGLDFFIHRYNTNGFLTTGYTTFGTAWHLWTLGEHFRLTRDTHWLRRQAPELARVGHWVLRQTAKTRRGGSTDPAAPARDPTRGPDPPVEGLMPPGVLADWNAFAYHFCLNAYYYAALRELAFALGEIGDTNAAAFAQGAADLRDRLRRAYAWTQARAPVLPLRNGTWIPAYPSQLHSPGRLADFFPGQDAGRSWCYDVELGAHQLVPAGVLDPHSREVTRLLDHMEDVQFLADGWFDYPATLNQADWFNLGGFSKVQPYYTRNAEIYALRDEVTPFLRSYFNTLASLLNPEVLTFWEHFRHSGAWDKTHETAYFLQQTRFLCLLERGEDLWLAPFLPRAWLRDGNQVSVRGAPTFFGAVSYALQSRLGQGEIEATVTAPSRQPPRRIVLRLRHPDGLWIRAVSVNGRDLRDFDARSGIVRLTPAASQLHLRVRY